MQRRKIRKRLEDGFLTPSGSSSKQDLDKKPLPNLPVPQSPAAMAHSRQGIHDPDLAFRWIEANRNFYRHDEAMKMLERVASFVKPIMRKRGWQVGTLAEFYPDQAQLLGVNINHGERICLRLRYSQDVNQFLPFESITDTLLHELSHNVRGPHDAIFHQIWNELREEAEQLLFSGFTGESFLGKGQQLGGYGVPQAEKQRMARAEAIKRRQSQRSQGHVLGGRPTYLPRGPGMRDTLANAADRRAAGNLADGCGSGTKEGIQAAEEAKRLGFSSKQDMEDANEIAIQRALIELMEEDRQNVHGGQPMAEGLTWTPESGLSFEEPPPKPTTPVNRQPPPVPAASTRPSSVPPSGYGRSASGPSTHLAPSSAYGGPSGATMRSSRPTSRLVSEDETRRRHSHNAAIGHSAARHGEHGAAPATWTCNICTLVNERDHLICDACGTERPESVTRELARAQQAAAGVGGWAGSSKAPVKANEPWGWNCERCGAFMESQWWTCTACGLLKASS